MLLVVFASGEISDDKRNSLFGSHELFLNGPNQKRCGFNLKYEVNRKGDIIFKHREILRYARICMKNARNSQLRRKNKIRPPSFGEANNFFYSKF